MPGEVAYVVELVENPHFSRLAEIGERRVRGATAHRGERVIGAVRETQQRLAEENLDFLGQIGVAEFLARPLDLGELRRELDACRAVAARGEAQKNGRVTVVAEVHDTHLARLVDREVLEARHGDGCDVRHDLTMGTGDGEVFGLVVVQTAGEVDVYRHYVVPAALVVVSLWERDSNRCGDPS